MKLNLNMNLGKRAYPTKRQINLVVEEKQGIEAHVGTIIAVIFLVAAVVVGKYGIVDRLAQLDAKKAEAVAAQQLVDKTYEELRKYGDIDAEYAHYTYKDFTEEELTRADRVATVKLIDTYVLPISTIENFQLKGNILNLSTGEITLGLAKEIIAQLETDPLVDFCTIRSAETNSDLGYIDDSQIVNAEISVYLKIAEVENNG